MYVRKPTHADFRDIKKNLAQRLADEYRAASYMPDDALRMLKRYLSDDHADAIVSDSHEPLAILFYWLTDEDLITTSFMAKEAYFTNWGIRPVKRQIRVIQKAFGNRPVVSDSYSKRSDLEDWYQRIGYRVKERTSKMIRFVLDPAV